MKHTSITLLTLTAAASFAQSAPGAASSFAVTGNVAITSDYVFRGLSQTANHSAIQGGFDLSKTPVSGLTAGVWSSSLTGGTELDLYANYGFKVGSADVNVGYIHYNYSAIATGDAGFANASEANVSATISGLTLKISKGVSGALSDYYYEANYSYDIAAIKGLNLGLHYGDDRNAATKGYDYAIALTYPILGLDASISYSDKEKKGSIAGDSITAFTVKKSF
jgi:uncharacterized protein (TIGR02001 family)